MQHRCNPLLSHSGLAYSQRLLSRPACERAVLLGPSFLQGQTILAFDAFAATGITAVGTPGLAGRNGVTFGETMRLQGRSMLDPTADAQNLKLALYGRLGSGPALGSGACTHRHETPRGPPGKRERGGTARIASEEYRPAATWSEPSRETQRERSAGRLCIRSSAPRRSLVPPQCWVFDEGGI